MSPKALSREEILSKIKEPPLFSDMGLDYPNSRHLSKEDAIILLMLDIRDLLTKENE